MKDTDKIYSAIHEEIKNMPTQDAVDFLEEIMSHIDTMLEGLEEQMEDEDDAQ